MTGSERRPFVALVTLALAAVAACNAVLGIEPATLDPGTGGSGMSGGKGGSSNGGTGGGTPAGTYDVAPECATCLEQKCSQSLSDCLKTTACRQAAAQYTYCVGRPDPDLAACSEDLIEKQSDLGTCVKGCMSECMGSPVISNCALYCGCMSDLAACKGFGSGDCNSVCNAVSGDKLSCLENHCENSTLLAKYHDTHCQHASQKPDVCQDKIDEPCTAADQKPLGFPCQADSDCCKSTCNVGSQVCQN